jgi:fucose permease
MTAVAAKRQQAGLATLLVTYISFVLLGLPDGLLGVAWPSMRAMYGVPLEYLGLLLLPGTAGYILTSALSGRLIAWRGIGAYLVVGVLLRTVGLLGFVTAPTWTLLLVANLVAGLGTGAIDAGMNTYVAANYSAGRLSWLHACFGLGATVGPLIMTGLLSAGRPWQGGYLLVAVLHGLLVLLLLAYFRRWQMPGTGGEGQPDIPHAPVWATLRIPAVVLAVVVFFLYTGVEVTGGNWAYTLWTEGRGIDPTVAGTWISLYWGALTFGRIITGIIVDRVGAVRLLRWSMVGVVIGAALVAVRITPAVSFLGLALVGLAEASIFPTMIAIVPERFGPAHGPNVIGFQIGAAGLGVAVVPGLAGVLAGRIGLEIVGPYMIGAALLMWVFFEATIRRAPVQAE